MFYLSIVLFAGSESGLFTKVRSDAMNFFDFISPMNTQSMEATHKKCERKSFTEEEDNAIREFVKKYGTRSWNKITQFIPNRSGRHCRDRYRNYLAPGIFNGQWTDEEDELLMKLQEQMGPQWTSMQLNFTNRSPNAIRKRWTFLSRLQDIKIISIPQSQSKVEASTEEVTQAPNYFEDIDFLDIYDQSFEISEDVFESADFFGF